MSDIVIHGFETSNNFKVRIALGFKEIPYAFKTIDPADREAILEMSGQPFTPVMVHGDVVMYDSGAIIRYLEANFPGAPRLFSRDYGKMRDIETWEWFCRTELHEPLLIAVRQRISGEHDEVELARGAEILTAATAKLEARLADNEWLVGDRMTAADVTGGAVAHRFLGMDAYPFPEDRDATRAWTERVMAFDAGP